MSEKLKRLLIELLSLSNEELDILIKKFEEIKNRNK